MIEVVFDHKKQENYNVSTFYFRPKQAIKYTAGQFIEMYLPHNKPDSRGEKRWFTLSSPPGEELISITTKLSKEGSSFKGALGALKPGEQVKIVEPMGDFVLPKNTTMPLVWVAGGIGVTPYLSMVKWLLHTGEKRHLQVVLAARQPEDIFYDEIFKKYGASVTKIVTDPDDEWQGLTGSLSGAKILQLIDDIAGKRIYISGPEPMVEFLEGDLQKEGVPKSQLVGDFFPGYKQDLG